MALTPWNDDDPTDLKTIGANSATLIAELRATSMARTIPGVADVLGWHSTLYAGCAVPVAGYVGHFRGDVTVPGLVGYEAAVGPVQRDGYPEKLGVWSQDVEMAVTAFLGQLAHAVDQLDAAIPPGIRPTTVDQLHGVVRLTAVVHGEWVRIHPFANGNGRTARVWAAWIALRYGLPIYVSLKPRPSDTAYAQVGKASMGRPPDFKGDHALAINVFSYLLSLSLLP